MQYFPPKTRSTSTGLHGKFRAHISRLYHAITQIIVVELQPLVIHTAQGKWHLFWTVASFYRVHFFRISIMSLYYISHI
jgi:hypothetical protein